MHTGAAVPLTTTFHTVSGQSLEVRGQLTRHPSCEGEATIRGLFQNITAQEFHAERVSHGATRDALTNLANRAYFAQHLPLALARARRQRTLVGVVYIDLDSFRDINTQVGHTGGGHVLIAIGDRLKRCVRTEDLLARLDGDHFALVLERLHTDADAAFVVERILATSTTPLLLPTDEEVRPAGKHRRGAERRRRRTHPAARRRRSDGARKACRWRVVRLRGIAAAPGRKPARYPNVSWRDR